MLRFAEILWLNFDVMLRFASMSSASFGDRFEYKDVQYLTWSYVLLPESHALSFFIVRTHYNIIFFKFVQIN